MKRSKGISLILMGSLSLAGAGCGSEKTEQEGMYTFSSLNECVSSGIFDEAQCKQMAADAVAQAPRFSSREECEAQFGVEACVHADQQNGTTVRQNSGSMWMPMLAGFMAGRFMGSSGMMQGAQGLYRDPAANPAQGPSYRTAAGDTIKPGPGGKVANPSPRIVQSMQHNAKPVVSRSGSGSRGGFSGGAKASS